MGGLGAVESVFVTVKKEGIRECVVEGWEKKEDGQCEFAAEIVVYVDFNFLRIG